MPDAQRQRPDLQISGMAGEFLTAGKLFKRGVQAAVTMGNARAIGLFVLNPRTDNTFNVQVKTLRAKNAFPMRNESVKFESGVGQGERAEHITPLDVREAELPRDGRRQNRNADPVAAAPARRPERSSARRLI
jgi:hypothetical protein